MKWIFLSNRSSLLCGQDFSHHLGQVSQVGLSLKVRGDHKWPMVCASWGKNGKNLNRKYFLLVAFFFLLTWGPSTVVTEELIFAAYTVVLPQTCEGNIIEARGF